MFTNRQSTRFPGGFPWKGSRRFPRLRRALAGALLVGLVAGVTACRKSAGEQDRSEELLPQYLEARKKVQAKDYAAAISAFQQILRDHPDHARAHLELGVLYDEREQDYISAIHHYREYLRLRPDTEKKRILEDTIRHAEMRYAGSLPLRPTVARKIEELQAEVAELRRKNRQLAELAQAYENAARQGGRPALPRTGSAPDAAADPAPTPPGTRPREYVVQTGDTLSSISEKIFGTASRWKDLYEANKATLSRPDRLKVGEALIIPQD